MCNDLVSVIIPCYNQAHFLDEAIESVRSQTHKHFEIIVVNDGSTDNTHEVAKRYDNIVYKFQRNKGLASARITGAFHSKGSYLVFLDSDDRLLPEALETGVESSKTHPECAFVFGKYQLIASDGSPLPTPQQTQVRKDFYIRLLRKNFIGVPAMVMYRRSAFEHIGGFRKIADAGADYDLYIRIAREFPIHGHSKTVVEYRVHDGNMTKNNSLMLKSSVTVRRAHMKYVKGNRDHLTALLTGLRVVQEYYGGRLINDLHANRKSVNWLARFQILVTLLRYHPLGFINLFSPKLYLYFFARYEGKLEMTDFSSIGGWAWDMNRPNTPLEIEILVDNKPIATVPAAGFRKDLEVEGKGNGYHGFCYQLPNELKDRKPHSKGARVAGANFPLHYSP